jgi:hypothetical protein
MRELRVLLPKSTQCFSGCPFAKHYANAEVLTCSALERTTPYPKPWNHEGDSILFPECPLRAGLRVVVEIQ